MWLGDGYIWRVSPLAVSIQEVFCFQRIGVYLQLSSNLFLEV